ncbi:hypothetical protein COL93_24635 [Bacillus toyonensis]|uniref:Uncharacterized protein n=1 Tax=Bacillus toyonensis TaxID=155322 RepID=A0A2C4QUZ6_9BACI|nr:hypothetical protein COL93_24635 [Bacillus toyonensis]PHD68877.1 hypothetical protein COF40_16585 [Bacillus toyonensis]
MYVLKNNIFHIKLFCSTAVIQIHQFLSRQMKNKKNLADTRFFSDPKTFLYTETATLYERWLFVNKLNKKGQTLQKEKFVQKFFVSTIFTLKPTMVN